MRYSRAFVFFGWAFTVFGLVYLWFGGRGLLEGGPVSWSLAGIGLVAVVVGTALVRWGRRQLRP
ncbi:MAG TPA: hypothetical protein VFS40_07110 [Gemmatimonadales bacterium]|nr:hypothetical protein [Gemmatimonadales bacterium]